jgi:hypothetical protein
MQATLEQILSRLQTQLGLGQGLQVRWLPGAHRSLSGEVKHATIYIYDDTADQARLTLYHEVIDYAISHAIAPYQQVANALIQLVNHDAYQRKERIVEALVNLVTTVERDHARAEAL